MKLAFSLLFLATGYIASAASTAELLEQVRTAAKAEARAGNLSGDPMGNRRANLIQGLLSEFDSPSLGNPDTRLIRIVEGIEMNTASEKLEALCEATVKQLRAELEQQDAAMIEEMKKGFLSALQTSLAATTPKELDAPIENVNKLLERSNANNTFNPTRRLIGEQGWQLLQFLKDWQEHLAGIDSGNGRGIRAGLRELLDARRDFSAFMSRSELLTRIAEIQSKTVEKNPAAATQPLSAQELDQQARAIVASIHTLKDMEGAIQKLEALSARNYPGQHGGGLMDTALAGLRPLQRSYADLQQGLATNLSAQAIQVTTAAPGSDVLISLTDQLLMIALPRMLEIEGSDAPKPEDNPSTYLSRIAAKARSQSNWDLLRRTIDLAQTLRMSIASSSGDRATLESFLSAINQEKGRQYALATTSLLSALRTSSQIISAEVIGDHLDKIRKEHPKEYEEGLQMVLNPPPMDPRSRMGYFPGPSSVNTSAPQMPPPLMVPAVAAKDGAK